MAVYISRIDPTPVYQQIARAIRQEIATGRLKAGEALEPIRLLAQRLSVTSNTVQKAYDQLEHAGIVIKRGTIGTYVADNAKTEPFRDAERLSMLDNEIDSLIASARNLEIDLDNLVKRLRGRFTSHAVSAKERK